jgi:peptidoglycan/xylan/chitin deacetylase (PgdA/CDA1 family)
MVTSLLLAVAVRAAGAPAPGDRVEPFSLLGVDDRTVAWKPGRVTVFSFCAFWCDTWKEQGKRLAAAGNALGGLPVDFVTISVDGRWSERAVGKVVGVVLLDSGGALRTRLGIGRVPYTMVVDATGKVGYAAQGIARSKPIEDAVRVALGGRPLVAAGEVYLAFDDFPSGELDQRLLDLLRAEDVPATFFCIGKHVEERSDIVRRAAEEGHSLQLHSWDHRRDDPQLDRCVKAIAGVAGVEPTLYHPPGTTDILELGGARRAVPVVTPYDYARPGEEELSRRVLHAVKPGCVIMLHAGVSDTMAALPAIIRSLKARGFTFGTL